MAPTLPQSVYDYWNKSIDKFNAVKEKYGAEIKPGEYKGI
jgi:phosphoenolpyruvate carboxykinase (GTP)